MHVHPKTMMKMIKQIHSKQKRSLQKKIETETAEYDDSFILNLAKNDKDLNDSLNLYLEIIFGEINSEKQIKEAFYIRDRILPKT
jgi:hypothetical protein